MGWQFSCHLKTGRNVKDLSPENVLQHIVLYENKCKFIPKYISFKLESLYQKRCLFSCHLMTRRNVKDLSQENVYLIF